MSEQLKYSFIWKDGSKNSQTIFAKNANLITFSSHIDAINWALEYVSSSEKSLFIASKASLPDSEHVTVFIPEKLEFLNSIPRDKSLKRTLPRIIPQSPSLTLKSWRAKLLKALSLIDQGEIEKIVLSLSQNALWEATPNANLQLDVFSALETLYPGSYCFSFAISDLGNSFWSGASPELLMHANLNPDTSYSITSEALAGTVKVPNDNCDSLHEYSNWLIANNKNLAEQQIVSRWIYQIFQEYGITAQSMLEEKIKKFGDLIHITSSLSGVLRQPKALSALISDLHPTPAICGSPKARALAEIKQIEPHSREYYTGFVGIISPPGDLTLAVNIRSALYSSEKITAYAGCGIVNGSDPENEYLEVSDKLQSIFNIFR
jgi:isochorismate synthase